MKKYEIILIAISFIITGFLFFVKKYFDLEIDIMLIGSVLIIVNSLLAVFNSLQNSNRSKLVWSTFMFLIGVLEFTISKFNIGSIDLIILPSVFIICCGVFLMLFIENAKGKIFIVLSLVCAGCLLFLIEFKDSLFINSINQYIGKLLNYKGVILFVIGWLLISNRKKIKSENN